MKYFIPQIEQTDCGFACLKMLIAHLYEDERALFIKQDENHGPYNMLQIKEKGAEYGISLLGVEIPDKRTIKETKTPFIAVLKKKNEVFHYVLVTKVKWGSVYYSDPEEGESSSSMKAFFELWTGEALLVDDFEKKDIEFQGDLTKRRTSGFLTTFFQIISALSLCVGIFFIDEKTSVYIPLLFLVLSFTCEILMRVLLVKKMEKMDDDFTTGLNADRKKLFQVYERYEDYKKKSLSSKMNLIFSFFIIVFISFITLYNNIYNAFVILIPLIISIIDVKYVDCSLKEKDQLICIDEQEIVGMKNIDTFKKQMEKIHLRGYKVARLMLAKKYIYAGLIAVVALLTTVFNETFSLPYVIFYFAIGYMLLEQYINFMKYPEMEKELLKSKVRLNNLLERI